MSVSLYMDHHVESSISKELRRRGVDVLTALEDGSARLDDETLLDRAGLLGRILFTRDADFLMIAARRQRASESFAGVVFAHLMRVNPAQCIDELSLIASAGVSEDFINRVTHLPL